MRFSKKYFIISILSCLFLFSCTIQRRVYCTGNYIERNHVCKYFKSHQALSSAQPIKKPERKLYLENHFNTKDSFIEQPKVFKGFSSMSKKDGKDSLQINSGNAQRFFEIEKDTIPNQTKISRAEKRRSRNLGKVPSPFSIMSLALGILGLALCLFLIPWGIVSLIFAGIFGIMGIFHTKSDPKKFGYKGIAWAGLIMGAGSILLIALFFLFIFATLR